MYTLLWILTLGTSLLLVGLVTGFVGRKERPRGRIRRVILPIAAMLIAASPGIVGIMLAFYRLYGIRLYLYSDLLPYATSWTVAHIVGAAVIIALGLRSPRRDSATLAAARWPRRPLGLLLAVTAFLSLFVFLWIDGQRKEDLKSILEENSRLLASIRKDPPKAEDDAAPVYLRVVGELNELGGWPERFRKVLQPDLDVNEERMPAFANKTRDLFLFLHQASQRPGCYFAQDEYYGEAMTRLPYFLALHMRTEAMYANVDGVRDAIVSLESLRHNFTVGSHYKSTLAAAAMTEVIVRALEAVLAEVEMRDGMGLLTALPERPSLCENEIENLTEEEIDQLVGLSSYLLANGSVDNRGEPTTDTGNRPWCPPLFRVFFPSGIDPLRGTYARCREILALPYHGNVEALRKLNTPWDSCRDYTEIAISGTVIVKRQAVLTDTKYRLSRLAIAVAAFRGRHGHYPESLADLVPDFINAIPQDPGDGRPLKMLKAKDGVVLYGVGLDGVDDGGGELEDRGSRKEQSGDITFCLGQAYTERRGGRDGGSTTSEG